MSILHRSQATPSSSIAAQSSGTSAKGKGHTPASNNTLAINRKRSRPTKSSMSKTSKLLWTIGTVGMVVAILNYVNSLAHHGSFPSGVTLTFSLGDAKSKWLFGTRRQPHQQQHDNELNSERHFLPPPRKRRKDLLLPVQEKRNPSNDQSLSTPQKTQDDQHAQKVNRVVTQQLENTRQKAAEARDNNKNKKPINGQQLQYQKELAKGEVHSIAFYLQISREQGHDKERLLHLLRDNAGIRMLSKSSYDQLPTWSEVVSMYGDRPRLVGLEQCKAFQADGDIADKYLAVAGAFNSGTNLLSKILTRNCVLHQRQAKYGLKQRGIRWQVPYGKHTPPKDEEFRNSHVAAKSGGVTARQVLPVVTIRHWEKWLASMCNHHYTCRWPRVFPRGDIHNNYHCPNLYPLTAEKTRLKELGVDPIPEGSNIDLKAFVDELTADMQRAQDIFVGIGPQTNTINNHAKGENAQQDHETHGEEEGEEHETEDEKVGTNPQTDNESATVLSEEELDMHYFPVRIKYSNFTKEHRSLVHFYNEWYQEYLELHDYPRLMVRMEDLLFFPDEVVPKICECAGGQLVSANSTTLGPDHVRVVAQSAKAKHSTKYMEQGEEHTGYLDALIKYGNSANRFRGMTPQDLQYASRHLDRKLVDLFGYDIPESLTKHP